MYPGGWECQTGYQIFIVWSALPLTSMSLSGLKAMHSTDLECPVRVDKPLPDRTFQSWIVVPLLLARVWPSRLKATDVVPLDVIPLDLLEKARNRSPVCGFH